MKIGIPSESFEAESRVAATPDSVRKLLKLGYQVTVQSGAGDRACLPDKLYVEAGAEMASVEQVWQSDILFKVRPPSETEIAKFSDANNQTLVSFVWPAQNAEMIQQLAAKGVTTLSMDCVPRISRAQKLDALSSMANIAGYRAVVEASNAFGSFFTGQITAAGKVPPAKVLVIGAGVAGLAAIGAARGLGAIVRAFDTRPAVKEQVKSMGADFLELDFEEDGEGAGGYAKVMSKEFIEAEMALFADQAKEVDIIVTTALIPGKPAPKLITTEMVRSMKPGSVIVDLAAEQGGNCELTEPGEKVVREGVTIIGYTDLPSRLAKQSSSLYSNNLVNLISDMTPEKDGQIAFDLEDEVVRGCLVTHNSQVTWPPPKPESPPPTEEKAADSSESAEVSQEPVSVPRYQSDPKLRAWLTLGGAVLAVLLVLAAGIFLPEKFVEHFTVFVLACFVGWQVIWNVNPALHTPLMSVTNAISGIIIVGAMVQVNPQSGVLIVFLACVAVFIASINIAGGFWVTRRMLGMFQKQD